MINYFLLKIKVICCILKMVYIYVALLCISIKYIPFLTVALYLYGMPIGQTLESQNQKSKQKKTNPKIEKRNEKLGKF